MDDDELLLLSAREQHKPAGYMKSFAMDTSSPVNIYDLLLVLAAI